MTGHYVAHDAKGYQVWRLVNGKYRLDIGKPFPGPRPAMAYADALDAASDISPLRPATRPAQELPPAAARIGSPVGVVTEAEGG